MNLELATLCVCLPYFFPYLEIEQLNTASGDGVAKF